MKHITSDEDMSLLFEILFLCGKYVFKKMLGK